MPRGLGLAHGGLETRDLLQGLLDRGLGGLLLGRGPGPDGIDLLARDGGEAAGAEYLAHGLDGEGLTAIAQCPLPGYSERSRSGRACS